jgi:hypothetical protein
MNVRPLLATRLAVVALILVPLTARAQVTGNIIGTVYDQNGMPLAGVKISARSPTQIGGARITHTNVMGEFRMPGLQPGVFEVSALAPAMKQVVQKDIRVGVTSPAEVQLIMEVQSTIEEVKVVETPPTLSTTKPNLKETYDLDFVQNLPLDGLPTKVEPFVRQNTPGAGASGDRYRGGNTRQNLFMVEGFSMLNQRYTMGSLATIEAETAAFGAENAQVQGAVVNMVTKSGSNRFEFDVHSFYEDNRLAPFQQSIDRSAPTGRIGINPGFSGPIIKDRLWYYANFETRYEFKNYPTDPAGQTTNSSLPEEKTWLARGSLKLTYQISPRNKIQSFTMYNREAWADLSDGIYEREAETTYNSPRMSAFTGLSWDALLTDEIFLRSQVGIQQDADQWFPELCKTNPECFHIGPVERLYQGRTLKQQNYERIEYNVNRAFEIVNSLDWYKQSKLAGEHHLKLTSRFWVRNEMTTLGVPGDIKTIYNGSDFDRQVEYFANDPRYASEARHGFFIRDATGRLFVNSISDAFKATRYVTVNAGLAYTLAISDTNAGKGSLNLGALTPHLSVVWDATHDGRTALRASLANHVDGDAVRISKYALGDQVSRECKWNDATQKFDRECFFSGGANSVTFGRPCGPQGLNPDGTSCVTNLRLPRMWEYTLGAERELFPGVSLGGDFVYRVFTHPFEMFETNRIWNPAGTELNPIGSYRNGRAESVRDLETSDKAKRSYTGVTAVLRRRTGRVKAQVGYTWSRLAGNVDNNTLDNNPLGDDPGRDVYLYGLLKDDRRHDLRGSATWQVTNWLSLGSTFSISSGNPYTKLYRNSVTGKFEDQRACTGCDPNTNPNDPTDDRNLVLPDMFRLNLKVVVNFRPLTGQNLEAYVDVLNLLNTRTVTAVNVEEGPAYNTPKTLASPMLLRLGARYKY